MSGPLKPPPPKPPALSPVQLTISAAAAVTTTVAGSLFSDKGTLIGAGAGSVISGVAAWAYARVFHHAKSRLPAVKVRPVKVSRRRVLVAGGAAVAAFTITMAGVTGFEAASGQTLHASVTGSGGTGTTLGRTVLANHPVRPAATASEPPEASSVPASPSASTVPAVGGTPGTPPTPVTMTPSVSPSPPADVNVPSGAASPAPAQTQQPGGTP